tara:strand:- start:73 stop:585 length:513 start_codon:yes stop_codon:yes gene_type:complete
MAYLKRYSAPKAHVRRVLWRKLNRCLEFHGGEREEVGRWIENALDQAVAGGLINDERYIRDKVRGYLRRGASARGIAHKLGAKGVPQEQVYAAIEALSETGMNLQWISVAAYVRRRRMGPFRTRVVDVQESRRKDLGRLGRAGFPMDLAYKILEMDVEEIEDIAFERRFI